MQKPRLTGRGFCNKKRGEEKNEKEEEIYIKTVYRPFRY